MARTSAQKTKYPPLPSLFSKAPPPNCPQRISFRFTRTKSIGKDCVICFPPKEKIGKPDGVESAKEYEYYEELAFNSTTATRWREYVARALANHYALENPNQWTLGNFPEGFKLFKRVAKKVGEDREIEVKLWGGLSAYSKTQFVEHALWLRLPPYDETICQCPFCKTYRSDPTFGRVAK